MGREIVAREMSEMNKAQQSEDAGPGLAPLSAPNVLPDYCAVNVKVLVSERLVTTPRTVVFKLAT